MNVLRSCRLATVSPTAEFLSSIHRITNNQSTVCLKWLRTIDVNRRQSRTLVSHIHGVRVRQASCGTHLLLRPGSREHTQTLSGNISCYRQFVPHNISEKLMPWQCLYTRQFRTNTKAKSSPDDDTDRVLSQLKHEEESIDMNAGWLIRLANENGYLSWCRNVYIATVAGATVYSQSALVPYANEASIVLLLMAGVNLAVGTSTFVYNVVHLRNKMMMGRLLAITHIVGAVLHMTLWFGSMAIYLGYVQEVDEDDESNAEPHEVRRYKDV